mgnify:CR=1 FL=1
MCHVKFSESCAGDGGDGYADLYIDSSSTWIVTGNSELRFLSCEGSIRDSDGQNVTVLSRDGAVLYQGESDYTVTVNRFNDSADVSGAAKPVSFEDAQVNNCGSFSLGGGRPPEMPDGGFDGQRPPEMPDGRPGGRPPEMPGN